MRRTVGKFAAIFIFFGLMSACAAGDGSGPPAAAVTGAEAVLVSSVEADAAEPAIAAAEDGRVFVAYVEKRGEGGDLFVRAYDTAAGRFGAPVRVNPNEGETRTWYGDPPTLAAGPGGRVYVGWTARYPDGAKGTMLFLSVSEDGGATFGAPARVNDDDAPASHGMHSMAVGADGRIYFAWLDERYLNAARARKYFFHHTPSPTPRPQPADEAAEPNAELYFTASADGGRTFGRNVRVAADVCPCCKTAIVQDGKGGVYIGFRKVAGEFRHIAVVRSADGGATFGPPVEVSDDRWRINACPVSGPAMRLGADGALTIAWFSGGEAGPQGFYETRSTDAGATFAPRTLVGETPSGGAPAWAGERMIWSADGRLRSAGAGGGQRAAEFASGKNVVAADAGGRTFCAFVDANGDKKAVRFRIL